MKMDTSVFTESLNSYKTGVGWLLKPINEYITILINKKLIVNIK